MTMTPADQPEPKDMQPMEIVTSGDAGDDMPGETVIETGWATIRTSGNATVITGQIQNFFINGTPGQGTPGAARWQLVQAVPETAAAPDTETIGD
jgi:hypothetical protein